MKNYKYFRVLVCLLLVCCLLVNVSPIKARATSAAIIPVAVPVAAPLVIGAILIGLGVTYGVSSGAFDDLIDSCAAVLSDLGDIVNDKINLYVYNNRSYVDPSIIRNVRGHLFSKSVLTEELDRSTSIVPGVSFSASSGTCTINNSCYGFLYFYGASPSVILIPFDLYSASNLCTYDNGTSPTARSVYTSSGYVYYVEIPTTGFLVSHMNLGVISNISSIRNAIQSYFAGEFEFSPKTVVVTDYDVSLGVVAPSIIPFDEGYSTWGNLALQVDTTQNDPGDGGDDGEDLPAIIYPIQIPESQLDFSNVTQEDVWAGGTMSVPGTGTGTGSGAISGTISLPGWVQDGINNLLQGLKDLLSGVLSLPASIASSIWDALPSWLQEGIISLKTGLVDILDSIASLPVAIAEALAAVFVPSADYISAKVEALRGEFGFIDSVIATGEFIRDSVSGASGPPVIYVDLGRASSGNYGSQRVLLTDFSWYAPYKGQVDTVLSAALWAFFGWRVFLKLPGIIGGESGYISDVFFPSSSGRSGSDDKKKGGKG